MGRLKLGAQTLGGELLIGAIYTANEEMNGGMRRRLRPQFSSVALTPWVVKYKCGTKNTPRERQERTRLKLCTKL